MSCRFALYFRRLRPSKQNVLEPLLSLQQCPTHQSSYFVTTMANNTSNTKVNVNKNVNIVKDTDIDNLLDDAWIPEMYEFWNQFQFKPKHIDVLVNLAQGKMSTGNVLFSNLIDMNEFREHHIKCCKHLQNPIKTQRHLQSVQKLFPKMVLNRALYYNPYLLSLPIPTLQTRKENIIDVIAKHLCSDSNTNSNSNLKNPKSELLTKKKKNSTQKSHNKPEISLLAKAENLLIRKSAMDVEIKNMADLSKEEIIELLDWDLIFEKIPEILTCNYKHIIYNIHVLKKLFCVDFNAFENNSTPNFLFLSQIEFIELLEYYPQLLLPKYKALLSKFRYLMEFAGPGILQRKKFVVNQLDLVASMNTTYITTAIASADGVVAVADSHFGSVNVNGNANGNGKQYNNNNNHNSAAASALSLSLASIGGGDHRIIDGYKIALHTLLQQSWMFYQYSWTKLQRIKYWDYNRELREQYSIAQILKMSTNHFQAVCDQCWKLHCKQNLNYNDKLENMEYGKFLDYEEFLKSELRPFIECIYGWKMNEPQSRAQTQAQAQSQTESETETETETGTESESESQSVHRQKNYKSVIEKNVKLMLKKNKPKLRSVLFENEQRLKTNEYRFKDKQELKLLRQYELNNDDVMEEIADIWPVMEHSSDNNGVDDIHNNIEGLVEKQSKLIATQNIKCLESWHGRLCMEMYAPSDLDIKQFLENQCDFGFNYPLKLRAVTK